MSNFPNDFDDDTTLPFVNDNITEIGGEAINALRDAVFAVEQNIGIGAAGTTGSIAARLGVSFFPDGYLKPSVIASMGLVTLPITQDQIAPWAMIPESKLRLDHRTQDLFNYIRDLSGDVNLAIGWISTTGVKLDPHLLGAIYRHTLDQIEVNANPLSFLSNKFRVLRDNLQSYNLVRDMNNELLAHQWADGSPFGNILPVTTNNSSTYPSNYGHTASGIYLNTSRFATVPQTTTDLQLFAEYIDGASIFLLGGRIQNLYSNGISRASRSSALDSQSQIDGIGQHLVPTTPVTVYLKNIGNSSSPFDDINTGDDIIEFKPSVGDKTSSAFDAKFALVKVGDIIRVNYGNVELPYVIKEKKYNQNSGDKKYIIRIAGKNLEYTTTATARIDRPLFFNNKYGVLSLAAANNNFTQIPSLIVASPRGGEALGVGFSPEQFDQKHYLLYLALYPTGSPQDGYTILPPIDVTGNLGVTPGLYTLESIVEATNTAFRAAGYNYRFVAFSYQGEFGIMLADSYGNAAFSILSAVVDDLGFFDQVATELTFSNNVIDLFPDVGSVGLDPLGFGPYGSGVASPPYMAVYGSAEASQNPTKLFVPLSKNNFYINGIEKDRMSLEVGQALDGYGDGYWRGQIVDQQVFPGPTPSGRVQTTYRIPLDLSTSSLKVGKTLVAQKSSGGALVDFGRFTIQSIAFGCTPTNYTDITVYDSVHAKGFSPTTTLGLDGYVALYFNSDSVSFNDETATDYSSVTPFKRHFEVYVRQDGSTFTHERGRFLASGASILVNSGVTLYSTTGLAKFDIIKISPKLRGYQFGSVNKITLHVNNYDTATGIYDGFLASYDGVSFTRQGPIVTGKKGEVTRFYDETNIDYVELVYDINTSLSTATNQTMDIQLFPTLSLDDELMLIGTCQLNDSNNFVNKVRDERQFGNTSEKEISTSLYNFLATPERLLHLNGVVRGFEITDVDNEVISLRGGVALVNGKFQYINDEIFSFPKIKELYNFSFYPINWALCVNSEGELVSIPLTDYDGNIGLPNDPNRLFTVSNAVLSNSYIIDSTTFSNLINNRKDLTLLYFVLSSVTGYSSNPTVSLTTTDVRRFINDQDSSTIPIVTQGHSQGNFKSFISALDWLRYNNPYQSSLALKGPNVVSGDPNFSALSLKVFSQGDGASLTFGTCNVDNFTFTDLPITVNGTLIAGNTTFKNSGALGGNVPLTVTSGLTLNSSEIFRMGTSATDGIIAINSVITRSTVTAGTSSFTSSILDYCNLTINGNLIVVAGTSGCDFKKCRVTVTGSGTIDGFKLDNGTLSIGTSATISNSTFTNCNVSMGTTASFTNVNFVNCTITVAGVVSGTNISMVDCTSSFTSTSPTTIATGRFVNCTSSFSGAANLTDVRFIDCTLAFSLGGAFIRVLIDPSIVTLSGTITGNDVEITDSTIGISAVRGFTLGNNFSFMRNTVTWTGTPSGGYVPEDLVNGTNGLMFASIGAGTLSNIQVIDNIFLSSLQDHFPFFAIEMTNYAAVANNISVVNNKFTSTSVSDDIRAVISVVSTLNVRAASTAFPQFPTLVDVHFDNNIANNNQMIVISSIKDTVNGYMNGAAPSAIDVTIDNNVCGTIGFFISSPGPYDGNNVGSPNFGIIRDKANKLIISNNVCKLITNLDSIGNYIPFRATAFPANNLYEEVISTIGEASILYNSCNWILVGAGGYTVGSSGVNIIGNTISPSNAVYLSNFTSVGNQSVTPPNVAIVLRREHNAISSSSSVIAQNKISQKFTSIASPGKTITNATNAAPIVITTSTPHGFLNDQLVNIGAVTGNTAANGTWVITVVNTTTFSLNGSNGTVGVGGTGPYGGGGVAISTNIYYYDAGIVCFNQASITNNTITGVINSETAPMIYIWDINSQNITGNNLERRGLKIRCFFEAGGLSGPSGNTVQRCIFFLNMIDAVTDSGTFNRFAYAYGVAKLSTGGTYPNGVVVLHNMVGQDFNY